MKKIMLLSLVFLIACSKKDISGPQYGTVIFYTIDASAGAKKWLLFVDDIERGTVPYTMTIPSCTGISGLRVKLSVGKHFISFQDSARHYFYPAGSMEVQVGCQYWP